MWTSWPSPRLQSPEPANLCSPLTSRADNGRTRRIGRDARARASLSLAQLVTKCRKSGQCGRPSQSRSRPWLTGGVVPQTDRRGPPEPLTDHLVWRTGTADDGRLDGS